MTSRPKQAVSPSVMSHFRACATTAHPHPQDYPEDSPATHTFLRLSRPGSCGADHRNGSVLLEWRCDRLPRSRRLTVSLFRSDRLSSGRHVYHQRGLLRRQQLRARNLLAHITGRRSRSHRDAHHHALPRSAHSCPGWQKCFHRYRRGRLLIREGPVRQRPVLPGIEAPLQSCPTDCRRAHNLLDLRGGDCWRLVYHGRLSRRCELSRFHLRRPAPHDHKGRDNHTTEPAYGSVSTGVADPYVASIGFISFGVPSPTGSVEFFQGSISLGKTAVTNAQAILVGAPQSSAGTYGITAIYSGDTNYLGSSSAASSVTVSADPPYQISASVACPVFCTSDELV